MTALLTYAIGDIHGCYDKLTDLVQHCMLHGGENFVRLIFLGDYVDRGARSRDVVDFLIELQANAPDQVTCLRGNHEDMLLKAVDGTIEEQDLWLMNGAGTTLQSYGAGAAADLPQPHLDWLGALPVFSRDVARLFVHAGIMPGIPLERQATEALLWIREPFLSDPRDHGLFVVHGHTPLRGKLPDLRCNRLNLDTGAVFGGPLTAAVFDDVRTGPLAFITDDGTITPAPPLDAVECGK